jgi:hypothetical protein
MMNDPPGETRKQRESLTRQAVADVVRLRLFMRRQQQKSLALQSEFSRSHLRAILRAEKSLSLFLFVEVSRGLGMEDSCELLREVLARREALRTMKRAPSDNTEPGFALGAVRGYLK